MSELRQYDEIVQQILQDWKTPGAAVAVIQEGEVLQAHGYGFRDLAHRLPPDADTVFAIGSTSKAFTGVTAGILVDRGQLEWDAPVRQYMPDFALQDPFATERMSVRDLLSHRSGLPRHDSLWYGTPCTRHELVSRLRHLQPNADFRTTFQYQNLMFMAAGALVERISGQTWEDFTQETILEPLGMARTSLSVAGIRSMENAARPYAVSEGEPRQLEYRNLDAISPAGGVNSCLNDLVKWVSLHLEGGQYHGRRIISAENLQQLHTPVTVINTAFSRVLQNFPEVGPESYAMGWFVHDYRGHRVVRHGGHIDGFSTQISFMPSIRAGVIVLSNIGGSSWMFAPTFAAYDLLLGLPLLDWSSRIKGEEERGRKSGECARTWFIERQVKKTRPSHTLDDYVGTYVHPGYGTLEVGREKESLTGTFNGRKVELVHVHYDVFDWPARGSVLPMKVRFESDILGLVQSIFVPLEVNVPPVRFERLAAEALANTARLEMYSGSYDWNGKAARVEMTVGGGLRLYSPDFAPMRLDPYQKGLFRVAGQSGWYVEFSGEPVMELRLVHPTGLFTACKV